MWTCFRKTQNWCEIDNLTGIAEYFYLSSSQINKNVEKVDLTVLMLPFPCNFVCAFACNHPRVRGKVAWKYLQAHRSLPTHKSMISGSWLIFFQLSKPQKWLQLPEYSLLVRISLFCMGSCIQYMAAWIKNGQLHAWTDSHYVIALSSLALNSELFYAWCSVR